MRNDLLHTLLAARIEERKDYERLRRGSKDAERHPKPRPLGEAVLSDAVGGVLGR
jgi:hypothetical protein